MTCIRKILHITADGDLGGGTTNVLALTEDFLGKGYEVHLCSQMDSYALEKAKMLGAVVHGANFFRSRLDLAVPRRLDRIIRKVRPEVIHFHGTRAGFFSSWMMRPYDRSVTIYTARGYHFLYKNLFFRYLGVIAERRTNLHVDASVFVSRNDQDIARKYRLLPPGKNGTVIYNGIRPNRIPQASGAISKSIIFVGRLVYQKNPHLLVDIMHELRDEGYILKMIGGGDLEQEIKKRIQKLDLQSNFVMMGSIPHEEVINHLKKSEVFLLPSRWEGLPVAPIEAMQVGIPVVLSNIKGNDEIVKHLFNGILITGQDSIAYANAIREICTDIDFRMYIISNGRQTVKNKFIQDRVTDRYIDLYKKCFEMSFTRRKLQE